MHTPRIRVAPVVGALISVIAFQHLSLALTLKTLVIGGAERSIIAKFLVREERTTALGRTPIIGAFIAVITDRIDFAYAFPGHTRIFIGAFISVLTKRSIGYIEEETFTGLLVATTGHRARIVIIGTGFCRSCTHTVFAGIHHGACVSVIARFPIGNRLKNTSGHFIAKVIGARLTIVAEQAARPCTHTRITTHIIGTASIPVITHPVGNTVVLAISCRLIATVVCARIAIIAVLVAAQIGDSLTAPFGGLAPFFQSAGAFAPDFT